MLNSGTAVSVTAATRSWLGMALNSDCTLVLDADALTLTPPCCVTEAQLEGFGEALRASLAAA